MKKKRNRSRPELPLQERLKQFAFRAREKAANLPPGSERDRLMEKAVANEDDAPSALQSEYRMREVVLAAAIQGAIFAATKAAIDRAGARGFKQLTGSWPGD